MKAIRSVRKNFSSDEFPVFTMADLKTLLSERSASPGYMHLLLHNLMKKKEVTRITRGVYTFHNDEVMVVGFAFRPFYYGLESAITLKGLWEQQANPIVVTPRRVRSGIRQFNGRNYLVRRIDAGHFFGYSMEVHQGLWIPVSDMEKTFIDMIYFKRDRPKEALVELAKSVDIGILKEYLSKYDERVRRKVMHMANELR